MPVNPAACYTAAMQVSWRARVFDNDDKRWGALCPAAGPPPG